MTNNRKRTISYDRYEISDGLILFYVNGKKDAIAFFGLRTIASFVEIGKINVQVNEPSPLTTVKVVEDGYTRFTEKEIEIMRKSVQNLINGAKFDDPLHGGWVKSLLNNILGIIESKC